MPDSRNVGLPTTNASAAGSAIPASNEIGKGQPSFIVISADV